MFWKSTKKLSWNVCNGHFPSVPLSTHVEHLKVISEPKESFVDNGEAPSCVSSDS